MSEIGAMKKTLHFAGYEVLSKDEFVSLQVRIADAAQRALRSKMDCGHARFFWYEDDDENGWCLRCTEIEELSALRAELERVHQFCDECHAAGTQTTPLIDRVASAVRSAYAQGVENYHWRDAPES